MCAEIIHAGKRIYLMAAQAFVQRQLFGGVFVGPLFIELAKRFKFAHVCVAMFAELWIKRKQRQQFVAFFDECATAGN